MCRGEGNQFPIRYAHFRLVCWWSGFVWFSFCHCYCYLIFSLAKSDFFTFKSRSFALDHYFIQVVDAIGVDSFCVYCCYCRRLAMKLEYLKTKICFFLAIFVDGIMNEFLKIVVNVMSKLISKSTRPLRARAHAYTYICKAAGYNDMLLSDD